MKEEEEEVCGCGSSKGNVLLAHYNVSYFSWFFFFSPAVCDFTNYFMISTFYLAISVLRVYVKLFVHFVEFIGSC